MFDKMELTQILIYLSVYQNNYDLSKGDKEIMEKLIKKIQKTLDKAKQK